MENLNTRHKMENADVKPVIFLDRIFSFPISSDAHSLSPVELSGIDYLFRQLQIEESVGKIQSRMKK